MNSATFDELRIRMRQQIRNVRSVDLSCSSKAAYSKDIYPYKVVARSCNRGCISDP